MDRAWGVAAVLVAVIATGTAWAEDTEAEEKKAWSGNVTLGLTNTTGNQDALALAAGADGERKWEHDRVGLKLRANFGRTEGENQIDNQSLALRWNHDITHRFFVVSNAEVARDEIQQIEVRFLANVGPGYRVWEGEDDDRFFDVEAGAGYRRENFEDAPDRDSADLRAAYEYRNELFESVDVTHTAEFLLPANETSDWLARTELVFALPIVYSWSFRTSFQLQYLNEPAPGNEELNTILTTGLQYDF